VKNIRQLARPHWKSLEAQWCSRSATCNTPLCVMWCRQTNSVMWYSIMKCAVAGCLTDWYRPSCPRNWRSARNIRWQSLHTPSKIGGKFCFWVKGMFCVYFLYGIMLPAPLATETWQCLVTRRTSPSWGTMELRDCIC